MQWVFLSFFLFIYFFTKNSCLLCLETRLMRAVIKWTKPVKLQAQNQNSELKDRAEGYCKVPWEKFLVHVDGPLKLFPHILLLLTHRQDICTTTDLGFHHHPLFSSSPSYSFSPSSCWLTPSPRFLLTIPSIIHPAFCFLAESYPYNLSSTFLSAALSRFLMQNCWHASSLLFLLLSLHLSGHPDPKNMWNCRQSIWGLRVRSSKTYPGRISSQSSTRNRDPRPSPRI